MPAEPPVPHTGIFGREVLDQDAARGGASGSGFQCLARYRGPGDRAVIADREDHPVCLIPS